MPLVGAQHEKGRVVRDGKVFTSGGVSAGIDFAFSIVAELAGPEVTQAVQLGIEYDPSPPFDSGHPTRHSLQRWLLWFTAMKMPIRGFSKHLRIWRWVRSSQLFGGVPRLTGVAA